MQETLAHEWRRRMAARSSLVAMLFAVPVFAALAIGFSGGLGTLSFGIGSVESAPGVTTSSGRDGAPSTQNLSGLLAQSARPAASASADSAGGSNDSGGSGTAVTAAGGEAAPAA